MAFVVTLEEFSPAPRYDGLPWTQVRIREAPERDGAWTVLETRALDPLDADPSDPATRSFTTGLATLPSGWYQLVWVDAAGREDASDAVYSSAEISVYTSVQAVRRALAPGGSEDATLGTAASLADQDLYRAIGEAAAEINSKLSARYSLPFTDPTPPLLEALNRDIAAFLATLVYRRNQPLPAEDPVRLRYQRAQALLDRLADGRAELLGQDAQGTIGESGEATVVNILDDQSLFGLEDFSLSGGYPRLPWEG